MWSSARMYFPPRRLPSEDLLGEVHDLVRRALLWHESNRGVGGAMKTGFQAVLALDADVVVKVDADGHMDPAMIPDFIEPILRGDADVTKGNRFAYLGFIRRMPFWRRLGNLGLSFLVKAASGYWHAFDPTNGYIAVRQWEVLEEMDRDRLADGFFFETSFARRTSPSDPRRRADAPRLRGRNDLASAADDDRTFHSAFDRPVLLSGSS